MSQEQRPSAQVIDLGIERVRRQPAPPPDDTFRLNLRCEADISVTVDVSREQLEEIAGKFAAVLAEDADDDGGPDAAA
jgi:hypothetical protein